MIVAIAFCPHPPALFPQLGGGAAGDVEELRTACDAAVRRLCGSGAAAFVVLGAEGPPVRLADFAPGVPDLPVLPTPRPLSLLVGEWLLDRAGAGCEPAVRSYVGVAPDGALPRDADPLLSGQAAGKPSPTALLVMGDASARRSPRAPGYYDERAEPFDAGVRAALAGADLSALAALDVELAGELLAAGVGPWRAAARIAASGAPWRAQLLFADGRFGVQYVVAVWER